MYEHLIFTDDSETVADMLKREWDLGPGKEPSITFDPKQSATSARYASIFIYTLNRSNRISSTDYRTLERTAYLGIRVSAALRENLLEVVQEVYRIIAANRRAGKRRLCGYTFMEVSADRFSNDLLGFYTCTLDIRMVSYNTPLYTAGVGTPMNEAIDTAAHAPPQDSYTEEEFEDI